MIKIPPLTELEGCVLGLLEASGTATPYALRTELLRSPSIHWSGSAGAIYPLIARLHKRRLIAAAKKSHGRREALEYHLTEAGKRALRAWIIGPLDAWIIAPPMDALRTRLRFAGVLATRDRTRLIRDALQQLALHVEQARAYCDQHLAAGDRAAYGMGRGALLALEARVTWLEEMLELEQS